MHTSLLERNEKTRQLGCGVKLTLSLRPKGLFSEDNWKLSAVFRLEVSFHGLRDKAGGKFSSKLSHFPLLYFRAQNSKASRTAISDLRAGKCLSPLATKSGLRFAFHVLFHPKRKRKEGILRRTREHEGEKTERQDTKVLLVGLGKGGLCFPSRI